MPSHKVTFEFEMATILPGAPAPSTTGSKAGWTETWYILQDQTDSQATTAANWLSLLRRQILTPGWALQAARISRLDFNSLPIRRGRLIFYDPVLARGQYPGANQDEQPYDALILSVNSAGGSFRHTGIRGIGADTVSAGGRYLAPGGFVGRFGDWANALTGRIAIGQPVDAIVNWALRTRVGLWSDAVTNVLIGGPALGGFVPSPAQPIVSFGPDAVPVAGNFVSVRDVGGMQRLNGVWQIQSVIGGVGAPTVRLAAKRRVLVAGVYAIGTGRARSYSYTLDPITTVFPEYGSSRRTGRPTQLVRGRRSNRAS